MEIAGTSIRFLIPVPNLIVRVFPRRKILLLAGEIITWNAKYRVVFRKKSLRGKVACERGISRFSCRRARGEEKRKKKKESEERRSGDRFYGWAADSRRGVENGRGKIFSTSNLVDVEGGGWPRRFESSIRTTSSNDTYVHATPSE